MKLLAAFFTLLSSHAYSNTPCDAVPPPKGEVFCYDPYAHGQDCVDPTGHAAGLVWTNKSDSSSAIYVSDAHADSLDIYRYSQLIIESVTPLECDHCFSWIARHPNKKSRYKINVYRDSATNAFKNDILIAGSKPGQWFLGYQGGECVLK
ncbi:MAG: hypothetical protein NTV34_20155 [Proteobacteria bacterium]|nr:hypothetical protein [Pseudomonadota bacterium]